MLEVMGEGGLVQGEDGLEVYVWIPPTSWRRSSPRSSTASPRLERPHPARPRRRQGLRTGGTPLRRARQGREADVRHAHRRRTGAGRKVGICGQAPSDYPEFAAFLVEKGIDSISLSPDAVVPTALKILEVERQERDTASLTNQTQRRTRDERPTDQGFSLQQMGRPAQLRRPAGRRDGPRLRRGTARRSRDARDTTVSPGGTDAEGQASMRRTSNGPRSCSTDR